MVVQASVLRASVACCLLALVHKASCAPPNWPSPVWDEMEEIVYQMDGYRSLGFAQRLNLVPCNAQNAVNLRIGFHDMTGHDAANKLWGIDSSLRWELDVEANSGTFGPVFESLTDFVNARVSHSDLLAAGLGVAVAACSGPSLPLRIGRVDATGPSPNMVPNTFDSFEDIQRNFSHFGFSPSEMISVIACGHTLGGVESDENPDIVTDSDKDFFDTTNLIYDHTVVSEYISGHTGNPLVSGPPRTDSDMRIFSSDGNATIAKMNSEPAYFSTCTTVLQKMVNSVPAESVLSNLMEPYDVRPVGIGFDVDDEGKLLWNGDVRVRTTVVPSDAIKSVTLTARDESKKVAVYELDAVEGGNTTGGFPQESFQFYSMPRAVNSTSVASFSVAITYNNGKSTNFTSNGTFFPVQSKAFFSASRSCVGLSDALNMTATIVAAVRKEFADAPVYLNLTTGVRDDDGAIPGVELVQDSIKMIQMGAIQPAAASGDDKAAAIPGNATSPSSYVFFVANISLTAWAKYQSTFDITVPKHNITAPFNKLVDILDQPCAPATVALDWRITYVNAAPAGVKARRVIGVNGLWPVAPVYANVGDTIAIKMTNQLDVPTALRLHGITDKGSAQYDGTPFVSQCAVPPGADMVYTVTLNQTGTFFINGNHQGQSVDGLRVPLIVRGVQDAKYSAEHVVRLSDWYDDDYSTMFSNVLSTKNPVGTLPMPAAILVNEGDGAPLAFDPYRVHSVRLISMASQVTLQVAIQNHNMTIVEVDGVPVQPYEVSGLTIAPAQRYGLLVYGVKQTSDSENNYLLQVTQNGFDATEGQIGLNATLVLSYDPQNPLVNSSTVLDASESTGDGATYDDFSAYQDLVPLDDIPALVPTQRITLRATSQMMADGTSRGSFNGVAYLTPAVPSLMTAMSMETDALKKNPTVYGSSTNPFILDDGGVTELTVLNDNVNDRSFHLHGHQFQIIAMGKLPYAASKLQEPDESPMRRDVILIPAYSYAVLRFANDNPGAWKFESSMPFLRDSGLAATFIEAPTLLPSTIDYTFAATCKAQNISVTGNAAGKAGADMSGYVTGPGPATMGITGAFWGTIFGCGASVVNDNGRSSLERIDGSHCVDCKRFSHLGK
ncbi:hypothetical protein HK101_000818, partial [Irineochytrium annulatum]